MPTKRTWRERQGVEFLSAYQAAELLTGEIHYPMLGYDGYGDGIGKDLCAFIGPVMRADWTTHRATLLAFWISGEYSSPAPEYQALVVLPRRARHAALGVVGA